MKYTVPPGTGVNVQNYDNPAKNWVRSWFFAAIDRTLVSKRVEPHHAVYFPGVQNLEGPLYGSRGIVTHPVERFHTLIKQMSDPRSVFHGTLGEWTHARAASQHPRLSIVNADFEGQVNTCADEIINLFRVFPARQGGLLCVTTFANMDPESIESGIVFCNAFDALLEGQVRPNLDRLYDQLRPYLEATENPEVLCHAQFCRDFGILWRVLMGLTLFTSPEEGSGVFDPSAHRELSKILGDMYQRAGRIQSLCSQKTFSFFEEPRLKVLMDTYRMPLFPLTIERVLYRSAGNNRMSTWIIFFGRLRSLISITQAAEQLWQLYSRSPLTFVSPSGKVRSYQPR